MERKENRYGLLGKNISYSFSKEYFTKKFEDLKLLDHSYENFDISKITDFPKILAKNKLKGLNVTIPYKEEVIPYLNKLDPKAKKIGAVNTIKFTKKGLKGYNTDIHGFQKSLEPLLGPHQKRALVLGTGGASKAIVFVLKEMGIDQTIVSRKGGNGTITYARLDEHIINSHPVVINCTPVGTFPNIEEKPDLPYQYINNAHILFDLIYNPKKTAFLSLGEQYGAKICNGLKMLELQAEKAWEIWNATTKR